MEGKKEMNKTWNLKEMKKLIPLALPVLVVNLSIVGMGAVDAIVAGRAGWNTNPMPPHRPSGWNFWTVC